MYKINSYSGNAVKNPKRKIDMYVASLLKEYFLRQKLKKEAEKIQYPSYFEVFDRPYKFIRVGGKITTKDDHGQEMDIAEALFGGLPITKDTYKKLMRSIQRRKKSSA